MASSLDQLSAAIEEMRDRIPKDVLPVVEALASGSEDARAEDVWRSIVDEVLDEA
jgi:hypothetical protein